MTTVVRPADQRGAVRLEPMRRSQCHCRVISMLARPEGDLGTAFVEIRDKKSAQIMGTSGSSKDAANLNTSITETVSIRDC